MYTSSCPTPVSTSRAEDNFQYNFSTLVLKIWPWDQAILEPPQALYKAEHCSLFPSGSYQRVLNNQDKSGFSGFYEQVTDSHRHLAG